MFILLDIFCKTYCQENTDVSQSLRRSPIDTKENDSSPSSVKCVSAIINKHRTMAGRLGNANHKPSSRLWNVLSLFVYDGVQYNSYCLSTSKQHSTW